MQDCDSDYNVPNFTASLLGFLCVLYTLLYMLYRHLTLNIILNIIYVAAKATYIRLLHGKIGILEEFFVPSSVHRGRTHIVLG